MGTDNRPLNLENLNEALAALKRMKDAGQKVCLHSVANSQDATGCCAAINKALRKGELDAVDTWTCPKCSMEWRVRIVEGVRYWECFPMFMLFR